MLVIITNTVTVDLLGMKRLKLIKQVFVEVFCVQGLLNAVLNFTRHHTFITDAKFPICYLVAPQSTFGHSQGDRFSPDLIIVYAKVPKVTRSLVRRPTSVCFEKLFANGLWQLSSIPASKHSSH